MVLKRKAFLKLVRALAGIDRLGWGGVEWCLLER